MLSRQYGEERYRNESLIEGNDGGSDAEGTGREVLKWSLSFEEESKGKKKGNLVDEGTGRIGLKKYMKRGHMPPIMRRASFYERMKDNPP